LASTRCQTIRTGSVFIDSINTQLEETGLLQLSVFICPSYKPSALISNKPENYIREEVKPQDLFSARIPRIKEILWELNKAGVTPRLVLLNGDTDPRDYVLPVLERYGVSLDQEKFSEKISRYSESFRDRVKAEFGTMVELISLSELGDVSFGKQSIFTPEQIQVETQFLEKLFSKSGPYKGQFPLTSKELQWMAETKFETYGKQGWIASELTGGIVLQTETPWRLRTEMLQSAGAPIAAIYPWIRKEELK